MVMSIKIQPFYSSNWLYLFTQHQKHNYSEFYLGNSRKPNPVTLMISCYIFQDIFHINTFSTIGKILMINLYILYFLELVYSFKASVSSIEEFKGMLTPVFTAVKYNIPAYFFFSLFRFAHFCVYFPMISKLTLPNSQVWNDFLSLQSLKHSIVCHPEHPPVLLRGEEEKKGGAGAEVLFRRALTPGGGVTGL